MGSRNRIGFLWTGIGCAVLFVLLSWVIKTSANVPGDRSVIDIVQGWENPALTGFMLALSWIGATKAAVVICLVTMLLLYGYLKHRVELLFFVVSVLGSYLLNKLIKLLFHRDRPDIYRIVQEEGFSYPSGHAMLAFAMYATITFLLWRHIPSRTARGLLVAVSAALMLGIGLSRIYLGVHYPSDVLGSYAAAAAWFIFSVYAFRSKLTLKSHTHADTASHSL